MKDSEYNGFWVATTREYRYIYIYNNNRAKQKVRLGRVGLG